LTQAQLDQQQSITNQAQVHTGWTYTLTFCDLLAILGVIVGLVGIGIAIWQYQKAKDADEAVADYKKRLFRQQSALRFSEIAPKGVLLAGRIRIKDWQVCAELSTTIGAALANASGFCADLIMEEERSSLGLATDALEHILGNLPVDPNQAGPDGAAIQEMTKKCMLIVYGVERIAGRLKSLEDLGEST